MTVYAYSFLDCVCALTGPGGSGIPLGVGSGLDEEGIEFAYVEDKDTMRMGADGTGMHSLHAGNGGTVTIRVLKTSDTNQLLSNLYAFQKTSAANWGQNTITFQNMSNGDSWSGSQGAFRKFPNTKYAKDGDILEWIFAFVQLEGKLGNGQPAL